jgi:hypothetical protein
VKKESKTDWLSIIQGIALVFVVFISFGLIFFLYGMWKKWIRELE